MFSSHVFDNSLKPARIGNKNRMKYKTRAEDACRVPTRDKLIVYNAVSLAWVVCRGASVHPRVENSTRMKSVDKFYRAASALLRKIR